MLKVGDSVTVGINEDSDISDIVKNPSKHYWKIDWYFPTYPRNPFDTPSGLPYGSDMNFNDLYALLGDDFITTYFQEAYPYSYVKEYGDKLLSDLNKRLDINVSKFSTLESSYHNIEHNYFSNESRYANFMERLSSLESELNVIQENLLDFEDNLVRTKRGTFDRRYSFYKEYVQEVKKYSEAQSKYETMQKRISSEEKRFSNSEEKFRKAKQSLEDLRTDNQYLLTGASERADDVAKRIKEDIEYKLLSGEIQQNAGISHETARRRAEAGLDTRVRYYATGQLIRSIVINCTLV